MQDQTLSRHPFEFVVRIGLFLSALYRQLTKTNLRVTGAGKVENQGVYYNVIFHMVYQVPKKEYTIEKIQAEAVTRFNLHKCIILDINDLNKDASIALPPRHQAAKSQPSMYFRDELKYAELY